MFEENLSQQTIVQQLQPLITQFEEEIVPIKVELLPNNRYAQNYAWMYSYEKKLKYRIQKHLGFKLIYSQEKVLFGAGGVVSEGLSNAFVHGHKKDRFVPINIWTAVSKKGLGFAITDSGKGFDENSIMKSFKNGGDFFHIAGNGFSLFEASPDFSACYQNGGKTFCILYLL